MPGKAGQVVLGNIVAEIVKKKKRIEVGGVAEAKGTAEMHACTFHGRLGFDKALYRTDGHKK
jgi:hypothetical protein